MKAIKAIALVGAAAVVLAFASCGSTKVEAAPAEETKVEAVEEAKTEEAAPAAEEAEKTEEVAAEATTEAAAEETPVVVE